MSSTSTTAIAPASTSGTLHKDVVPSEVGWQFVPQYYTFMNKQPDRLHCFYTKTSTFSHGSEGDDISPCHGQAEIHAKITSLNLQDCKVFIHSVDAQASLGGGIVIQVIGEMSNKEEAWRKFVQTFFLAEQPNGYFVLNDVFRYLKEETVEDEDAEGAAPPEPISSEGAAVTTDQPVDHPKSNAVEPVFSQESIPVPSDGFTIDSKSPVSSEPVPAAPARVPSPSPPTAVAGDWIEASPSPAPPAPVGNGVVNHKPSTPPPQAPSVASVSPVPSTPPKPAAIPAAATPPPKPATPSNAPPPTPKQQPPATTPAEKPTPPPQAQAPPAQPAAPPKPAAPKTWANLAAADSKKWGSTASSAPTASTTATSRPTTAANTPPGARTPQSQAPANQQGGGPQGRSPGYQAAMSVQTAACFIKGVVDPLSSDGLRSYLTNTFGPLKEIEVVRNKACAFIEFISLDVARRAIAQSLPVSQGGEGGVWVPAEDTQVRISIETRKERGERPVSTGPPRGGGRGGFDGGRGGANVDRSGSFRGGRGSGRGRGGNK